ncbi:unnamed protein product [Effrenium voratum]|uniref:Uncharacterized protein n=1 Tax=Effrenium voratum TaxID=2562239 RepID=A0AA36JLC4_9DINO|nr:unnamed protein product [Effrenium voratum]
MNSLELTRHAERLLRRRLRCDRPSRERGDWDLIAHRFAELSADIDVDLSVRLLRCLARAKFSNSAVLQPLVRDLPIAGQLPSSLTHLGGESQSLP